ncbi:MAG: DoxX family protein [Myxococcota bacterium]
MANLKSNSTLGKTIAYWATTILLCLPMIAGAVFDTMNPEEVAEGFARLGYPSYFPPMLGIAKGLGVLALLVPKFPRLKEWAYAGFTIDLIAAIVSHIAVEDPIGESVVPAVLLVILFASWWLRPAARRLPDVGELAAADPATSDVAPAA